MMALADPYLSHWVADQDQPYYPPGTDVFRLYAPDGRQVIAWLAGDHIPCWLDFLPNRDVRALFQLRRGDGELVEVPAGPLRQCIGRVMWSMEPAP